MKRALILILTFSAIAAVLYLKGLWKEEHQQQPLPIPVKEKKTILYLFHNPQDQDEECKQIYAFADRAEKELPQQFQVIRADVEKDHELMKRFSVHVLPTILIVSSAGQIQRFEGEGEAVTEGLKKAFRTLRQK